jgi:hypothetical protein
VFPLMSRQTVDMCGMTLIHFQLIVFSELDLLELAKVDLDSHRPSRTRTAAPTILLLIAKM